MAKKKANLEIEDLFSAGREEDRPEVPEVSTFAAEKKSVSVPVVGEPTDKPKRRFILYSRPIDKFTIKRTRVLLTPAVCDVCGLDLGAHNGLPTYDEMPSDIQAKIRLTVERHKKEFHSIAENLIVDEDQMPTEFLTRGV